MSQDSDLRKKRSEMSRFVENDVVPGIRARFVRNMTLAGSVVAREVTQKNKEIVAKAESFIAQTSEEELAILDYAILHKTFAAEKLLQVNDGPIGVEGTLRLVHAVEALYNALWFLAESGGPIGPELAAHAKVFAHSTDLQIGRLNEQLVSRGLANFVVRYRGRK